MFRKGTILTRKKIKNPKSDKSRQVILPLHEDMINNSFWTEHSEILTNKSPKFYEWSDEESLPELVLNQLSNNSSDLIVEECSETVAAT